MSAGHFYRSCQPAVAMLSEHIANYVLTVNSTYNTPSKKRVGPGSGNFKQCTS